MTFERYERMDCSQAGAHSASKTVSFMGLYPSEQSAELVLLDREASALQSTHPRLHCPGAIDHRRSMTLKQPCNRRTGKRWIHWQASQFGEPGTRLKRKAGQ